MVSMPVEVYTTDGFTSKDIEVLRVWQLKSYVSGYYTAYLAKKHNHTTALELYKAVVTNSVAQHNATVK